MKLPPRALWRCVTLPHHFSLLAAQTLGHQLVTSFAESGGSSARIRQYGRVKLAELFMTAGGLTETSAVVRCATSESLVSQCLPVT